MIIIFGCLSYFCGFSLLSIFSKLVEFNPNSRKDSLMASRMVIFNDQYTNKPNKEKDTQLGSQLNILFFPYLLTKVCNAVMITYNTIFAKNQRLCEIQMLYRVDAMISKINELEIQACSGNTGTAEIKSTKKTNFDKSKRFFMAIFLFFMRLKLMMNSTKITTKNITAEAPITPVMFPITDIILFSRRLGVNNA